MRTTLVIMAAGMATRFGGGKQVTPVDEEGQLIIDYSLYDAKRAGFDRAVFVIRPEMKESFHQAIGARVEGHMEVRYAYQTLDRFFPADCDFPEGRTKPWGTAHAALCARDEIDGPFTVINADAHGQLFRRRTAEARNMIRDRTAEAPGLESPQAFIKRFAGQAFRVQLALGGRRQVHRGRGKDVRLPSRGYDGIHEPVGISSLLYGPHSG